MTYSFSLESFRIFFLRLLFLGFAAVLLHVGFPGPCLAWRDFFTAPRTPTFRDSCGNLTQTSTGVECRHALTWLHELLRSYTSMSRMFEFLMRGEPESRVAAASGPAPPAFLRETVLPDNCQSYFQMGMALRSFLIRNWGHEDFEVVFLCEVS